jgi:hypothetical protein
VAGAREGNWDIGIGAVDSISGRHYLLAAAATGSAGRSERVLRITGGWEEMWNTSMLAAVGVYLPCLRAHQRRTELTRDQLRGTRTKKRQSA